MNTTLLFALVILFAAVLTALVLVGVVIYRSRNNKRRNPTQEISPDEAAEITSTFNLLNH